MDDFAAVFARLRAQFAEHAAAAVVTCDEPGRYFLGTHEVRSRDGYRTALGGVEIGKRYVSAHLMPVYVYPALLEDIGDGLRGRMQGKSCFNFTTPDEALLAGFRELLSRGVERFRQDGRLP
ncbi:MAG: hypothetical protein WC729_28490 [Sphingomonas sp.]|jgi:hypothetical protein|uniref:hypothetical protein n=1 Tax=Sphingomonas sp. TaxID=28214 RepID=UPI0035636E2A